MSKEVIEAFSKVRVDSSVLLNTMRELSIKSKSRGLSLATTSLEKGRMYLGEIQGNLGQEFPYEATKTAKTPKEIQEAVEVSKKSINLVDNEITNLNMLREEISKRIDVILSTFMWYSEKRKVNNLKEKFLQDANFAEAYRAYKEARMWLGVRLGEIKSNNG